MVRDENGEKMSKSKGNVIDPLEIIDGCDLESILQKITDSTLSDKEK
jgi:valyl-tRNA synthetase